MSRLNWPNRITIGRIVLVVPFVICLLNLNADDATWRYVGLTLFLVMALGDAADGFLARRLHDSTRLGRFLDPVGDKLLTTSALILLSVDATAVHGFCLPSWVPVIAIGKDVLTVIGFLLVYAVTGRFFVQPRILGKACTLVQPGRRSIPKPGRRCDSMPRPRRGCRRFPPRGSRAPRPRRAADRG